MGDTEGCRKKRSQSGRYLFEFALVLFGTAVFIVGATDVARIFHARGAVRAGVTEGLRCLYPTDAGCNGQSLGNGWFPNERFTARITGGDLSNFYELPRVSYNLSSAWFTEPVSEASFATKQLTGVTLTQPRDAYRQYQVLFPGTAHAVYLLKTQELPVVAPATGPRTEPSDSAEVQEQKAANRVLNPRFFEPGGQNNTVRAPDKDPAAPDLSRANPSDTVNFTIEMDDIVSGSGSSAIPWGSLKAYESSYGFVASCYEGERTPLGGGAQGVQWPSSGSPSACSYPRGTGDIYAGSDLYVPIMIHISGQGFIKYSGSDSRSTPWVGAKGEVVIELFQTGMKKSHPLGGRSFSRGARGSEDQWGNFVVRGAGAYGDYDNEALNATADYTKDCETAKYSECTTKSYVRLPLVKVGVPVSLKFSLIQSGVKSGVSVSWAGGKVRIFHPKFQATHEQRSCGYSASPNSCGTSVAPMQTSFRTTNLDQAFSYSQRDETTCGRTNPDGYQPSIPSALEGFRSEIQAGARQLQPIAFWSNGTSSDTCSPNTSRAPCSEAAREYITGCEPQDTFPEYAHSRCTLNDYQSNRDAISAPSYAYGTLDKKESRGGCTGEPFPECSKPHLATKTPVFLGAVSNGCAVAQPVNPEPSRYGPMYRSTCSDPLPGFIEEYRKKHNVPPSIDIPSGQRQETPEITKEEPDECWEYRRITEDTRGTWLCAEASSYAVANKCCKDYGPDKCSIERVTVGTGGGNGDGFGQIIEGARQRTLETVQASYPRARMDLACGRTADGQPIGDDCIDIQAGPEANGTQARVQASMRVPLALLDWFGFEDSTLVQYEESRMLESALVGEES